MQSVLIDITRLVLRRARGRLPTGVDRVGMAHVEHHAGTARALLVLRGHSAVLRARDSRAAFAWLLGAGGHDGARAWPRLLLWWLRAERGPLVPGTLLLQTAHQGLERADALGLRHRGVRPVVMVHDLIPLTHPEYCRHGEAVKHQRRMRNVLTRASGVIVNSRDTLQQLQAHALTQGLPMPPTVVAPLAPGLQPRARLARPLAAPYFVVLGTIEPRKNHLLLLQLWRVLVQRLGAAAPRLVVIGRRGWECQETLNMLDRSPGLAAHVHELDACDDADLAAWLQHARALLFPSFCEGYGLPAIEALSFGVPVIASDLPVLRESAGAVPDYASPHDGGRWLELITDYAQPDSPLRQAQMQRRQAFQPPRWDEHHRLVAGLFEQVRGPSPEPAGPSRATPPAFPVRDARARA